MRKATTLETAAGQRNTSGAPGYQGTYGRFWASTPWHTSGNGHMLAFNSTNGIWPANNANYANGYSVRCVAR